MPLLGEDWEAEVVPPLGEQGSVVPMIQTEENKERDIRRLSPIPGMLYRRIQACVRLRRTR